jgi:hypothetical protein
MKFSVLRYLSIILGRPFGIQDHDISISLPQELEASLETELSAEEGKLISGTVAHIQLRIRSSQYMGLALTRC